MIRSQFLMKRIDLVYFDAGGGHRSAAMALRQEIERQARPWEIRLVNLQDLLDSLDIFRKYTGIRLQDLYNLALKKGWTLGSAQLVRLIQGVVRLYHPRQVRLLESFWKADCPDLVVSLIPNFNRALEEGLHNARPHTPFVTILTDLADYPPHFWIERRPQYFVCGTERAVRQARASGHNGPFVFQTSGMILNPRFYEPVKADRETERARLGLHAQRPTGLVLFGAHGSNVMMEIVQRLDRSSLDLQLILICGHNQKLADSLRTLQTRIPLYVEGFTREIPYYMHLADFFIGKPGPGSISEALAMKLPVIVERNAFTMPQERYNVEWIREKELGLVVPNFRRIQDAVAELLRPDSYQRFRANAAAQQNRAVFEIPDILQKILTPCENSL